MLSGQEARVFGSALLQDLQNQEEPVKTENIEPSEVKKEEAEEKEGKGVEEKEGKGDEEREGKGDEEREDGNEGLKRKPEVSASQLSVPNVKKFLVNSWSG
jgi:hypothetical protein